MGVGSVVVRLFLRPDPCALGSSIHHGDGVKGVDTPPSVRTSSHSRVPPGHSFRPDPSSVREPLLRTAGDELRGTG